MTQAPLNQDAGDSPLVVLEGIDGSGKGTQALRLQERLTRAGTRAELLSFPRYQSTFFGSRIGEFLDGEFGALDQLDPFLISLLYAGDRLESRETLEQARHSAEIVVLDRYVPSNVAHQSAKANGDKRKTLRQWIEQVEYEIFKLPRPQLVVLLDIPVEVSQQLIRLKQPRAYTDQQTDLQESDVPYLSRVRDVYLEVAAQSPGWVVVPVTQDGELRSIEEVSDDIWQHVQQLVSPVSG